MYSYIGTARYFSSVVYVTPKVASSYRKFEDKISKVHIGMAKLTQVWGHNKLTKHNVVKTKFIYRAINSILWGVCPKSHCLCAQSLEGVVKYV